MSNSGWSMFYATYKAYTASKILKLKQMIENNRLELQLAEKIGEKKQMASSLNEKVETVLCDN